MGISYSFVDNIVYGTEDINGIARSLVGAGIAPFVSKESYSVSDLNVLTEALVGNGVQLDGCKCSCNVEDGTRLVMVNEGIMFFENGVRLEVDSDGYSLETEVNSAGYVYGYFNEGLLIGEVLFSSEVPDDGCVVLLAYIDENNNLTDRRLFSRSKIGTLGRNVLLETTITPETFYPNTAKPYGESGRYALARVNDVDISRFNAVYIDCKNEGSGGIFDLKKNKFLVSAFGISETVGAFNTNTIYQYINTLLGFEIVEGVLTYYGTGNKDYIAQCYNKTFRLLFM